LISPPAAVEPDATPKPEPLAQRIIPYLPDWPEIASIFAYPRLTPAKAISGGSPIAIIGQPGSGKTVALAHLACQVARKETAVGPLMDYAPFLFHILDLDLAVDENKDPALNMVKLVNRHAPVLLQNQLRRLVIERFRESRALLLIDGIDELHPEQFEPVKAFLQSVLDQYPGTRVVVSAAPTWLDGLMDLGFSPLALVTWTKTERDTFLKRWSKAWTEDIAPQISKSGNYTVVDPILINNWLSSSPSFTSPLEWTLKVWGAYAGDLKGPTSLGAIETYLSRFLSGLITRPLVEKLAYQFIKANRPDVQYSDLDRVLTEQTGPRTQAVLTKAENEPVTEALARKRSGKRDIILSTGEQILEELVNGGLLVEHGGDRICFASPVFCGVLSAFQVTLEDLARATATPQWPTYAQALHYLASRSSEANWIDDFIYSDKSAFSTDLLVASRWLKDAPPASTWKPQLFRSLATILQDETLPEGYRGRAIAAFSASHDATLPRLYRQLLGSNSPTVRKLAILGAGACGENQLTADIIGMMADSEEPVRLAACMALVAIGSDSAMNAVAETLMNADESLRQAAAEAIATIPTIGAESIRDASTAEDILTRRAAVFGLLQIGDHWAGQVLEKIAVEDGQWVVRNAAAQALEVLQEPDPHVPKPLHKPWDSPWLIAFASKRGQGVAPNVPANGLIHLALTTGTLDEQLAALEYARTIRDDQIIIDVYTLLFSRQSPISEAALQTVWYWTIGGVKLPPPHKTL
ncbi:MAG TPA: HEAT repeat domain-containing protein, partial [Anaerolinea sp.]|nr:HEAT repeat domain-containing protein [Anaerolinea sp.]